MSDRLIALLITDYGDNKIRAIHEIRWLAGVGLKAARAYMESLPQRLTNEDLQATGCFAPSLLSAAARLRAAGCTVVEVRGE